MKKLVVAVSLCCVSSLSFGHGNDALSEYGRLAQAATKEIKHASFKEINKSSAQLVSLARKILPAFTQSNPACQVYLDSVMAAADSMQQLSLEQIEADYHLDGKLPPLKSGDCYHAKDLLVHPATVVVMAKTLDDTAENRRKMAHEIEEVIEHLSLVKQAVH